MEGKTPLGVASGHVVDQAEHNNVRWVPHSYSCRWRPDNEFETDRARACRLGRNDCIVRSPEFEMTLNPRKSINPPELRGRPGRVVSFDRGVGTIKGARGREVIVHFSAIGNPRREVSGQELLPGDRVRYERTGIVNVASWVYRLGEAPSSPSGRVDQGRC